MDPLETIETVLVLVNTRPIGRRPDRLHTWSDPGPGLTHLAPGLTDSRSPAGTALSPQIDEARRARDTLTRIVLATSPAQAEDHLAELATAYPMAGPTPTNHHQPAPTVARNAPMAQLVAMLMPGLHQALATGVLDRLGVCPDPICQTVFLDRSRPRARRYCSPRCATRARMRHHRKQHCSPERSSPLP